MDEADSETDCQQQRRGANGQPDVNVHESFDTRVDEKVFTAFAES
jgi:hypothetical protein